MSSAQLLFQLIRNLGDIALFIIIMNRLLPISFHSEQRFRTLACGAIFSLAGLLSMLMPIQMTGGIMMDMRNVLVALGSFYGGGIAAAVCAFIVGAFRLSLGGAGAVPGVIVIATAAAIGLLFRRIPLPRTKMAQSLFAALFGIAVTVGNFAWSFLFPTPVAQLLLSQYLYLYLILHPLASYSIMYIMQAETARKTANLFDSDTGIPNKNWLLRKLRRLIDKRSSFHLIAFRIDNLSAVSAIHGAEHRQRILQKLSERFPDEQLILAGNQEFILCFNESEHALGMDGYMEQVRQRLTKPYEANDTPVYLFSNTVVLAHQGEDAELFIQKTLRALQDKTGASSAELSPDETLLRRYKLQNALYLALSHNQLSLQYQPQFDLQSGQLRGFEALLRWNHPVMGSISPAEFIPIAEETGLIRPIGLWVLEQACRAHSRILQSFAGATMSINISAAQLSDPAFPDQVNRTLLKAGLEPQSIELEITESMLISSFEFAERQLQLLESIGVLLALDDFGTGYSSLNYLKRLPLHTLKIDRSFTQDILKPRESKIMQSIVHLAKQLEYRVVAEGLETDDQLAELKKLNCDVAQGYLLSLPLPEENLNAFMAHQLRKHSENGDLHFV